MDGGVRVWVGVGKSDYLLIVRLIPHQFKFGSVSSYTTKTCTAHARLMIRLDARLHHSHLNTWNSAVLKIDTHDMNIEVLS